jgi:two-component system, LytTR family, sensor kinase
MMHRDVMAADRMLARLSELLRRTLAAHDAPEVSLREELELLTLFVDIETTRFRDRLSVTWDIEEGALQLRVPHLILQPLVENAVKHGIAPRATAGTIVVSARRVGEWLYLEVRDDGVGLRAATDGRQGVGLSNVRGRLAQLYPNRHHMELSAQPEGGTVVALVLPAQPAEPSPEDAEWRATSAPAPALRPSLAERRA